MKTQVLIVMWLIFGLALVSCSETVDESTTSSSDEIIVDIPQDPWELFSGPPAAEGEFLILTGRVLDRSGQPLPDMAVEIWQTDSYGVYDHPGDSETAGRDREFQFYGTSFSDEDGVYIFRTILPGQYEPRPRHIHTKVKQGPKELLTSQIYFNVDGEPRGVGGSAENLMIILESRTAGNGTDYYLGEFDFVLDIRNGSFEPTDLQGEGPYYPVMNVAEFDNDLAVVE